MTANEIVKVEELETEQFMALGLGRYEAIRAVEDGIDAGAVEALVRTGYPITVALEASR
jgi:hypothetical protein